MPGIIYSAVYFSFARMHDPSQLWLLFIIYGLYNGVTEGVGKALVADDGDKYVGEWKDGKMIGGTLIDGTVINKNYSE